MLTDCTLLVLAGGASRRMGTNKAMLDAGNGTILEQLLRRLAPGVAQAVVAGPPCDGPPGVRFVSDRLAASGPLAGMESGLQAAATRLVWVVACDLPDVLPAVGELLVDCADGYEAAVPRIGEQPDGLCAVYEQRIAPRITKLLDEGRRSVTDLLANCRVRYLSATELSAVDPRLRSFRNLNTPQDYEAWIRERRGVG